MMKLEKRKTQSDVNTSQLIGMKDLELLIMTQKESFSLRFLVKKLSIGQWLTLLREAFMDLLVLSALATIQILKNVLTTMKQLHFVDSNRFQNIHCWTW